MPASESSGPAQPAPMQRKARLSAPSFCSKDSANPVNLSKTGSVPSSAWVRVVEYLSKACAESNNAPASFVPPISSERMYCRFFLPGIFSDVLERASFGAVRESPLHTVTFGFNYTAARSPNQSLQKMKASASIIKGMLCIKARGKNEAVHNMP